MPHPVEKWEGINLERATSRAEANIIEKGYAIGWGPQKNGWYQGSLCLNEICEYSKKIPVIVGTAFAEFGPENLMIDREALTEEERERIGCKKYGRKRKTYMKLFKEAYPNVNASYAGDVDTFFRKDTMDYVLKKAAESEAPVYNYVFALESPMNGGTIAPHCTDIPFDKKLVEYIVKNTPKLWPDFYHDKEKPGTYYC